MTKAEFISAVSEKTALSKKDAGNSLNAILEIIENQLVQGEKVQIIGFGTFEVKERAERQGKNPATGETIVIPAHKVPSFKAGKQLKDILNQ